MGTNKNKCEDYLKVLTIDDLCKILSLNGYTKLYDIISSMDLSGYDFKFYCVQYRFGDDIISKSQIHIPINDGDLVSIDSPECPEYLRNDLLADDVSSEPLCFILKNCAELYVDSNGEINNENIFYPGDFIGIPRVLDPKNRNRFSSLKYNLSAGAKSAFMLQSIKDRNIYNKVIKSLNINITSPNSHNNHWQTFADIARHNNDPWSVEVILFPRKFINLINKKEFSELYVFLNKLYVKNYNIRHNMFGLWQLLHFSKTEKNTVVAKYNSLYVQSIKEFFLIMSKSKISFQPSTNDLLGPFNNIKKFYQDIYGLTHPTIMEPVFFDYNDPNQKPVYVSLLYQNIVKDLGELSIRKTKITILSELFKIFNLYLNEIKTSNELNDSVINQVVKETSTTFFHNSQDIIINKDILQSNVVIAHDSRFNHLEDESVNSSSNFFVAGVCIRKK